MESDPRTCKPAKAGENDGGNEDRVRNGIEDRKRLGTYRLRVYADI